MPWLTLYSLLLPPGLFPLHQVLESAIFPPQITPRRIEAVAMILAQGRCCKRCFDYDHMTTSDSRPGWTVDKSSIVDIDASLESPLDTLSTRLMP